MTDDNRSALFGAAIDYIERGWAVVPLHDVSLGRCSCRTGAECKTPGKHPRTGKGWELEPKLVRTRDGAASWWGAHDRANIGLATGPASGFWGFDVDPLKGGDVSLAELIAAFGPLPETRVHGTGSGGEHYLFSLPEDFEIGGSSGSLPRGLDVRGAGGQIVAPPSVTDRGGYWVKHDRPIVPGPEWLLAMIRPEVRETHELTVAHGEPDWLKPEVNGGSSRLTAYASLAVLGELRALAQATPGSRGSTAVRAAYRLIELINAPWSGLDRQNVWEQYCRAAMAAMAHGGAFDLAEAEESWKSAARKVGGRAAVEPPDPLAVSSINPGVPSLPSTPDGPPMVSAGMPVVGATDSAVDALLAKMLTPAEMRARPKPKPLVAGLLDLDTTAWMIAEPGGFKSFVALDIAARVASGQPWQGRRTHAGGVAYIVAEGAGGMSLRVDAWEREYGPIGDGLRFLPEPVQAADAGAWGVLVAALKRLGPVLVVIDTQARVTVGFEENSAKEMGIFIEAAEAIRRETGACVLVIHHLGRNGTNARGSSAIDGAQSTELRVVRKGKELACAIHQDKQKDADDSEVIELSLRKILMGTDPETGRELSSLVIDPVRIVSIVDPVQAKEADTLDVAGKLTLVLAEDFSTGMGGTKAEIMSVFRDRFLVSKSSEKRAWNACLDRDVMRSFEKRAANFRYNPPADRVAGSKFREAFQVP